MCDETRAGEEVKTSRGRIGACDILSGRKQEELKVVQGRCMRTTTPMELG